MKDSESNWNWQQQNVYENHNPNLVAFTLTLNKPSAKKGACQASKTAGASFAFVTTGTDHSSQNSVNYERIMQAGKPNRKADYRRTNRRKPEKPMREVQGFPKLAADGKIPVFLQSRITLAFSYLQLFLMDNLFPKLFDATIEFKESVTLLLLNYAVTLLFP